MGITKVNLTLRNPQNPNKKIKREFMVDSGAVYSVIPAKDLKQLGINPTREMKFYLADGTPMTRKIGNLLYEYEGTQGAAPVVFGQENDLLLLGAVTLESLGLVLNPLSRELKPMHAVLTTYS